ncbi:MAG: NIL domain-containing protein [Oscillospiraceae bacterium]
MAAWWRRRAVSKCSRSSPPQDGGWCPRRRRCAGVRPQAVRRVRLTFRDSVTTGTPLVARLASEEGILCTVISASTQKLSEEVYGSMLLGIPSGQFQRAMDYIGTMSNIRVEEVDGHVQ